MISEAPNQCYFENESEPTFAEFCKELTRRHHEYLQAKVRKDGDEYVVFCRMFNFVNYSHPKGCGLVRLPQFP